MKIMKMKAEARLDLLRQVGVAVETWLKSAMNQVMEELENECWNNLSSHDASLSVSATETLAFLMSCFLRVDVCCSCQQRDRRPPPTGLFTLLQPGQPGTGWCPPPEQGYWLSWVRAEQRPVPFLCQVCVFFS